LIDGPVNVPLILFVEVVAGAVVAGAVVAAGLVVAAAVAPELLVATGLALFVAAAVALVVALALEDDDEADALDVAPGPVTGPPAILIALVVPN
jgi:high-affinity Fe2+/Pb2+ permease